MTLTEQIKTEIQELAEEIDKINFGDVVIEIKDNKAILITYRGVKRPKRQVENLPIQLTSSKEFDKIAV